MSGIDDDIALPEIDLQITSTPVVAAPRKLNLKWSLQAAKDFRRDFGLAAQNQFSMGLFVCREDDMLVYGQVTAIDKDDNVTFRTPKTGAEHTVWADDLRKMNLLEVLALESV